MQKFNLLGKFLIIGLIFFLAGGCDSFLDVNPCTDVTCENDGGCFEGVCICPDGFIGLNCQIFDPTQVQALLTAGITPIELFNADIPLESLYGSGLRMDLSSTSIQMMGLAWSPLRWIKEWKLNGDALEAIL